MIGSRRSKPGLCRTCRATRAPCSFSKGAIQRELALISENKQLAAERDHAIATKAQIGARREAQAMAAASSAVPARCVDLKMSWAAALASPRSRLSRSPPAPSTRSTPMSTSAQVVKANGVQPEIVPDRRLAKSRRGLRELGRTVYQSIWRPCSAPLEQSMISCPTSSRLIQIAEAAVEYQLAETKRNVLRRELNTLVHHVLRCLWPSVCRPPPYRSLRREVRASAGVHRPCLQAPGRISASDLTTSPQAQAADAGAAPGACVMTTQPKPGRITTSPSGRPVIAGPGRPTVNSATSPERERWVLYGHAKACRGALEDQGFLMVEGYHDFVKRVTEELDI
ncbi:hypothetical protein ACPA9J_10180 [Pseudomonas aeruginosa]